MLKIFYGTERAQAQAAVQHILGDQYEVIEADGLTVADLPTVFMGTSLFGEERKILLKGLDQNKDCWRELLKYTETPHRVIVWNEKAPDKRTEPGKSLAADKGVELKAFERVVTKDERFAAFNLYDDVLRGRLKQALANCAALEQDAGRDPYSTLGALSSKAFAALERGDRRAPAILRILAQVDTEMKSTGIDGWTLLRKALVQMDAVK